MMTQEQYAKACKARAEIPGLGRRRLCKIAGCTDYAADRFLQGYYDKGCDKYAGDYGRVQAALTAPSLADGRILAAESALKEYKAQLNAVKRERDELLSEFLDLKNARPVPKSPAARRHSGRDTVRVCVGDVHGMMMDKAAVAAFLADVRVLNPDEVVLGGDILDCGGWLAKHQPLGFVANCDYSYQEDVRAANWFLDELQDAAPNAVIHYLEGNHEDRVERWAMDTAMARKCDVQFLLAAFGPRAVLRLDERGIRWYNRHEVHGKGLMRGWIKLGKMFFTHSLTYSRNAARDAVGKTAGNVTYWCTHREDTATIVFPGVGICKSFNPGCMCSIMPVYRHTDPTSWSQGYAIDFVAQSGNFQHIQVPIWDGESLAGSVINRFKR